MGYSAWWSDCGAYNLRVLLDTVAEVYGVEPRVLLRGGRQRPWFLGRAMLVYLVRWWSGMKTNELSRLLNCNPSMISRLYRRYIENRDKEKEEELPRLLED